MPFRGLYLPEQPAEAEQARVTGRSGKEALELGSGCTPCSRKPYRRSAARSGETAVFSTSGVAGDGNPFFPQGRRALERGGGHRPAGHQRCRNNQPVVPVRSVDVFPPASYTGASFDLIYAYSVFSHLSEEAHLRWFEEFARILKPGGIFSCHDGRGSSERLAQLVRSGQAHPVAEWQEGSSWSLLPDGDLAAYDRGEYCYGAIHEGRILTSASPASQRSTPATVGHAVRSPSLVAESRTTASDDGRAQEAKGGNRRKR